MRNTLLVENIRYPRLMPFFHLDDYIPTYSHVNVSVNFHVKNRFLLETIIDFRYLTIYRIFYFRLTNSFLIENISDYGPFSL